MLEFLFASYSKKEVDSPSTPPLPTTPTPRTRALQAQRIMIILIFPDSPGKPVVVRASTAIAVTVDGKTAIAAGRRYPEPLWWKLQGNVKVRAGRVELARLEHLSSWPEAHFHPQHHTHTGRKNKLPWI